MSYRDISGHIKELYDTDISHTVLSQITYQVIPEIKAWQSRSLKPLYCIVWFDIMTSYKVKVDGNITHLFRMGAIVSSPSLSNNNHFGSMDNLIYKYQGTSNKLQRIEENNGNDNYGFLDHSTASTEYIYDLNGNLKTDANKDITSITYNHLNLPTSIIFNGSSSQKIEYFYDANGIKLKKRVNNNGSITETLYAGNFMYRGGSFDFYFHPEGYVEKENNAYKYVYQYKDHLGNIRVTYDNVGSVSSPNASIVEEHNYYPFGGEHAGYNTVVNGTYHPYGYNGKEEQDELGLEWIDYGARNYDKWLGRYFNVDRLSEAYYDLNPYQYTANNPIKFIDVNGDYIYIWENGTQYRYENGEIQKQNEKGKWIKHSAQEGSYVSQIAGALGDITGGDPNSFGSQFLGLFENDDVNVSLYENTSQGKDTKGRNITQGTNIYTFFNQSGSIRTTGGSEKLSENFHITLGHELAHGLGNNLLSQGALNDTWVSNVQTSDDSKNIKNSEVFASMYENMLRSEQGLELRTHYIGGTSDNRSRLIQKSKTKNPFSKVYNPTQATLEIFNSLVRRPKVKSVNSIKPAGRQ